MSKCRKSSTGSVKSLAVSEKSADKQQSRKSSISATQAEEPVEPDRPNSVVSSVCQEEQKEETVNSAAPQVIIYCRVLLPT